MNTSHADMETHTAANAPIFDPFPEPRTYPSGWDLSELPASLPAVKPTPDSAFGA